MTQSRSSAVNASFLPSGDSCGYRICCARTGPSSTGYSNWTLGPSFCSTLALNGIAVASPEGTSTRQMLPSNDVINDFESGVNEEPRSEEHTSEPQSPCNLVCRLLLEKKKL